MTHVSLSRKGAIALAWVLCLATAPACTTPRPSTPPQFEIEESVSSTPLPLSVGRLAIVFPDAIDPTTRATYLHLEAQTFSLRALRPTLQFVDRTWLRSLREEQTLQLSGSVSDETSVRVGRLLGADSILHYHVECPTWRDQMRARFSGQLPPVRVYSKVIRVETGEVLFHHVVSVQPPELADEETYSSVAPLVHAAVARGVGRSLQALRLAFR